LIIIKQILISIDLVISIIEITFEKLRNWVELKVHIIIKKKLGRARWIFRSLKIVEIEQIYLDRFIILLF